MRNVLLIVALLLGSVAIITSCDSGSEAQVIITKKDGDSCLIDKKCKILVRRWYHNVGGNPDDGANEFYRCLVNNSFYEAVGTEQKVIMNLNSKNCEKLNP